MKVGRYAKAVKPANLATLYEAKLHSSYSGRNA